jgi:chromosome segregation ATPase
MTNPGKPAQPTSKYEEERLRAAEQSQFVYLQGQIDELRRLLKEQSNKYAWAMEQIRRVEASVSQIEGLLDRQRQENGADARQLPARHHGAAERGSRCAGQN